AFLTLIREGLPLTLTVCGASAPTEQAFWTQRIADVSQDAGNAFRPLGYVSRAHIDRLMESASLYCSATLGEGSSAARIAALCSGIPVVTTTCGEFLCEVKPGPAHLFLSNPGDANAFLDSCRAAATSFMVGELRIDWCAVETWRDRFSREREWAA